MSYLQHSKTSISEGPDSKLLLILILGALSTVSPFSIDMYLPAFSQVAADLGTTAARVSLSLSSYFVGLSIGQIFYGPLLDRFGRKKPLYFGLTLFILSSIGCVMSTSVEALILFRFLQALGGCAAQVASLAMVRDFFPVEESAKVISLLILILGVSPLLAPTFGSFIAISFGWQWLFLILAAIVLAILAVCIFFLKEGHVPDTSISLAPVPIVKGFAEILRTPQFYAYTLAGAFSFAGLFVYVACSPIIFMDIFGVSKATYGLIFAILSVGFIGSSQLNVIVGRRFTSDQIFKAALTTQAVVSVFFMLGTAANLFGLIGTIVVIFCFLACAGISSPNATAIALTPFKKNAGSASALIGFIQMGVGALFSAFVGIFNFQSLVPAAALLMGTSIIGLLILKFGTRNLTLQVHERLETSVPTH